MEWILPAGLVLLLVVMMMFHMRRRKRYVSEQQSMFDKLRPGMRIKTVAGTIGRIKELRDEGGGVRTILIETGHGIHMSFMLIDFQAVLSIMDEAMTSTVVQDAPVTPLAMQTESADCRFTEMQLNAREFVDESNKSRKKK